MRIASRFVLEKPASSGAMGTVFQAHDLQTGQRVALKLLQSVASSPQSATRLEFEASVLAKLRHPNIVSYIAHGRTPSGLPFLAMEWLQGEELTHRLRRSVLSMQEALLLLRGVASALTAAHRSGVIHRDIKPSNLFLPDGRIDQVKLLDFGVAREELTALALTRTGSILGTLEYMAPEQARGARTVGASADIFSLGCVLYECLTGRPPLQRVSFPELLIRMATEEFPPIQSIRPGLPQGFLNLLQRMFAKVPEQRPQDGDALLRELDLLGADLVEQGVASLTVAREPFSQLDQRLLCVVLVSGPGQWPRAPSTLDTTESAEEAPLPLIDPQEVLLRWGALTEWLGDGSLLISLTERGTASDLAAQAARVALQLAQLWPRCTAILATGLGSVSKGSASGQVVKRVLACMQAQRASEPLPAGAPGGIWLDGVTVGLLDGQFVTHRIGQGLFELRGEADYGTAFRPLAGRATPCVGRERELSTLTALLDECVDESMARATLLVAQHGRGKSRLRHELLSRLRVSRPTLTVVLGHGDPFCAAVDGAVLTDCLRRLAKVAKQDTIEAAQAKLRSRLSQVLSPGQRSRWLAPLCELGSQPLFYDGTAQPVRHERSAPRELIEQSFVQLMLALSAAGPILLVLEALQWADPLSVRVFSRVLSELAEQPLMVFALARPEVHAVFPRLWAEHRLQELRLEPLLPTACEQLIHTVLGPEQGAQSAPHILEHSRGNALFLEELILRAALDATTRQLPATLVTLEQGRLLRLPSHALRVLRAASVFGLHFWEEGLQSLLVPLMPREHIESGLQTLLTEDLVSRVRQSRFLHTPEFRFRHALTLAAAELLLSAEDRELSRTLVAQYL